MAKLPIDYSKTIIYKIVSKDLEIKDCYVGSTTDFISRKASHKKCCNNERDKDHNIKVYKFIREHKGWCNWSMIEIEKFPCKDKNEARSRERYWIETLNSSLNCIIPSRTRQEWYETNKDILSEKHKVYYKKNRTEIREQQSQKKKCECGSLVSNSHFARHVKSPTHQLRLNSPEQEYCNEILTHVVIDSEQSETSQLII